MLVLFGKSLVKTAASETGGHFAGGGRDWFWETDIQLCVLLFLVLNFRNCNSSLKVYNTFCSNYCCTRTDLECLFSFHISVLHTGLMSSPS